MAESAAGALLQSFDLLLRKMNQLLKGLGTEVMVIKDELEIIKAYLRETETKEKSETERARVRQLGDIACDIEDVLEDFMLHFGQCQGRGTISFLHRSAVCIRNPVTFLRMVNHVQRIRTRLSSTLARSSMYPSMSMINEVTGSDGARNRSHDRHVDPLFIKEDELIGIDEPREELIGLLVQGELQRKVISVVGMGGLGKTTLVKKVYDHERVTGWFKCHAWISVTQSFTIEDLLRSIIEQIFKERNEKLPEGIDRTTPIILIEILGSYLLDKRYVVVLDDVWCINEWNYFRYALPNNNCGSRILVTTRIGDVASTFQESSGHIYYLQPLSAEKAWSLFCKKTFRSIKACPQELEEPSVKIVEVCKGLPLAIVTICGILSRKEKNFVVWSKFYDNLRTELAENPEFERVKRLLLLSYNDLPYSHKSCFLYFSIFPKDYQIRRITLIRLWIAEGFIESGTGKTLEDVAEDYLNDLIDRNMVEVAEYYDYGRIRSCRVHGLIREILVLKSEEENFCTSVIRRNVESQVRLRRLSTHQISEDALNNVKFSHLRALFMIGQKAFTISSMHILFSGFRLLRILDLEGAPIESFPLKFKNLLHLRYLSLRNTRMRKLSKSVGELKKLETLDLKGTYISDLPKNILQLRHLRHLVAYHYYTGLHSAFYYASGVKVPQGIGSLKELQKLSYLDASQGVEIVSELGNLTQLRRLGIAKLRTQDGQHLCASIEKLTNLHSFSVTSTGMDDLLELQTLEATPPLLQRLYLRGPLDSLPKWIGTLQNLVRMRLRWSGLKEGSLHVLQTLPNLAELTLIHAYDGTRLCCEGGGFQKLKILDLEKLNNLNYVILSGAMPNLRKMYIRSCVRLMTVPQDIELLWNLKELHLFDMPEEFVQMIRRGGGIDRSKVQHIPIIRCYDNQRRVYEDLS
ncbi:disease resistance protein RPM1-like [Cocos nucifera]|uniref:Disease resistance protein RPM1-like n=1 Tax=Cocos nucifera TaxID=13894 RepID=A0A8K0IHM3_COCNU|nr:disease resistance protein RPM1-like [Cocos nucifera]KAG1358736.1 disease resistance protein RPM1-like [Cocos nucifera]